MPMNNQTTLIGFVTASLSEAAAERFQLHFTQYHHALSDETEMMIALNRFWRAELYHIDADTIDARESLLDQCDSKEWKSLFARFVLPLIEAHHLPR